MHKFWCMSCQSHGHILCLFLTNAFRPRWKSAFAWPAICWMAPCVGAIPMPMAKSKMGGGHVKGGDRRCIQWKRRRDKKLYTTAYRLIDITLLHDITWMIKIFVTHKHPFIWWCKIYPSIIRNNFHSNVHPYLDPQSHFSRVTCFHHLFARRMTKHTCRLVASTSEIHKQEGPPQTSNIGATTYESLGILSCNVLIPHQWHPRSNAAIGGTEVPMESWQLE